MKTPAAYAAYIANLPTYHHCHWTSRDSHPRSDRRRVLTQHLDHFSGQLSTVTDAEVMHE